MVRYIPKVNKKWVRSTKEALIKLIASRKNKGGSFYNDNYLKDLKNDEMVISADFDRMDRGLFNQKYIDWLW